jgi:hypothetical protein
VPEALPTLRPALFRSPRLAALATAAAIIAAGLVVHRFWLREFSHLTGDAQWIWAEDTLERVHPVAGLFVAPLQLSAPPPSALLKVCGDREYVVYINGTAAACGWSRPGFNLDLYEIGHLLHQGENAVAVEVRSPTPVGGVLLALDIAGVGRNVLVSGPAFALQPRFSLAPAGREGLPVPVTWGAPPRFPWGYPSQRPRPKTLDAVVVEEPLRREASNATELERGGWSLVLERPHFGYLWIEFDSDGLDYLATTPEATSNADDMRSVAQPIVRVKGQTHWLDPEPRMIGAVYVFGRYRPRAFEIWPVPEEFRPVAPGVVQGKHGLVPRTRWRTRIPPG